VFPASFVRLPQSVLLRSIPDDKNCSRFLIPTYNTDEAVGFGDDLAPCSLPIARSRMDSSGFVECFSQNTKYAQFDKWTGLTVKKPR
jgi:hypothetical protein